MKTKTESILIFMNVLAWMAFIGLMVKAGGLTFSYIVSILNPEAAKNLYREVNLYDVRQFTLWNYTALVSFSVSIIIIQAYIAYLVINVLTKIRIEKPFTSEISSLLEKISYLIFSTWIIAVIQQGYIKWLSKSVHLILSQNISFDFIFLAGIVFVIAQVFKRGVELQSENELTV